MKYFKYILVGLGMVVLVLVFMVLETPDDKLHVVSCNVGQGDAHLIIHKYTQILVDGGPNSEVVNCLSKHMPFWDRTIELVVLTHPESDHYAGLIDVFENYNVKNFLGNELDSSNESYKVLKNEIEVEGGKFLVTNADQDLELGLIYLDILHPSESFLKQHKGSEKPNVFSVTFILHFGEYKMLFTGDLVPEVADKLVDGGLINDVDVLKIPHHGSKNGLDQKLLDASNPEVAVISVGKNSWGHPHKEVLEMLGTAGVQIYRTDQKGDVEIVSDGEKYWVE